MNTINKMNEVIAEFARQRQEFQTIAQNNLKAVFKEFFDETPEIKVIKWTQYTPYFNDGDPCYFSVHEPTFSNCDDSNLVSTYGELDMSEDEAEQEGLFAFEGTWSRPDNLPKHVVENTDKLCEFINASEMEDVLLAVFGDHVCVTVTRDGIDVEEYSHD